MDKKRIFRIVVIAIVLGFGYLKFFTMVLDNKEKAIVVKKDWGPAAKDLKSDVISANNIFIAEVYEDLGTEKFGGKIFSLYKARITFNIKGRMLDDPIIAIPGGFYKESGKLKLLKYNDQGQLKTKQMYRFITHDIEDKNWMTVTPYIGVYNLNNEDENLFSAAKLSHWKL